MVNQTNKTRRIIEVSILIMKGIGEIIIKIITKVIGIFIIWV